ncbi:double-strand break repair helicase AddA [Bosea vestrisii]|uniref:double-strand break repair helicase AddA n=1 Tax=Bosea vestrisii TaxID=151416 RepID=UPI0024DF3C33|nr:double-strand break repair helicase AddA [Bosea vestrisii]WID94580.1 double-strand break repair helicase AddA [Bosea vestrisii]
MTPVGWTIPAQTSRAQSLATEPDLSAWVSANAGSGKTHVLVNRVLRLLLDGVAPGRMLCITYTKAAAANMSNRVFRALSAWAVATDTILWKVLTELTGQLPAPSDIGRARRLFAQALETPGGLKIETIHAFCTRVLQSAPFEANVPPRFEVADDLAQSELMRDARRDLLAAAEADSDGPQARALRFMAEHAAQDTFDQIMREALHQRAVFSDAEGRARKSEEIVEGLSAFLGISPELTAEAARQRFQRELVTVPDLERLLATFETGSATRIKAAVAIRVAVADAPGIDPVAACRAGLLTAEGNVAQHVRGKGNSALPADLDAALDALAACLTEAIDQLNAIAVRERSAALAVLVTHILAAYRKLKAQRSLLDYDDLIAKTRSLLDRVDPAWALYKLDAGIDHILLDEAQDTSEAQWAILRRLSEEFSAGEGAREQVRPRTVFVVGDEKQSIYGFQGAAPAHFSEERRLLGRRLQEAGQRFEPISLTTSFRSAPDIMRAVDAVFAPREHWRGLVFDGGAGPERHDTVKRLAIGAVDLWPVSGDDAGDKPDAWTAPVDAPERRSGLVKLAARIADVLKRWSDAGRDDIGRPFKPGDVMILLRQRGALFEAIVKALKDRGVPVAGRDRLTLADHPAVEDLAALGRTILLPQDDLSLAITLKTPLFGLDDEDLMRLAPERKGSLREAFRKAAQSEPRYAAIEARLTELAEEAGRCGPFRFFAGLLGPGGGRNLALARLGPEAADALDAFLSAALDHERRYGPSLAGFLHHIGAVATQVKRDLSASAGEVRVMTVHGSKGLEAPVVILADLGVAPGERRLPKLMAVVPPRGQHVPVWPTKRADDPTAMRRAKDAVVAQMIEEHHRLLYVALTRAEDRLILCGTQAKGEAPEGSWYAMAGTGLAGSEPWLRDVPAPDGDGEVRRFMVSQPGDVAAEESAAAVVATTSPDWLTRAAPDEAEPAPPLRPSSALAAADGQDRPNDGPFLAGAAAAGRLAHLLLQVLPEVPPERRASTAHALAEARGGSLPQERRAGIVEDALALIAAPEFGGLFGPGSLAEVPLAGEIIMADGSRRPVQGRIDRLAVGDDEVLIADFKTAARPPENATALPASTLAQLAVYRRLVGEIYPGRRVRAIAIYTASLKPLEPGAELLDATLATMTDQPRFTGR